jgi:hypothetical protein
MNSLYELYKLYLSYLYEWNRAKIFWANTFVIDIISNTFSIDGIEIKTHQKIDNGKRVVVFHEEDGKIVFYSGEDIIETNLKKAKMFKGLQICDGFFTTKSEDFQTVIMCDD